MKRDVSNLFRAVGSRQNDVFIVCFWSKNNRERDFSKGNELLFFCSAFSPWYFRTLKQPARSFVDNCFNSSKQYVNFLVQTVSYRLRRSIWNLWRPKSWRRKYVIGALAAFTFSWSCILIYAVALYGSLTIRHGILLMQINLFLAHVSI